MDEKTKMKKQWIENEFKYDGSQLKSLFAYLNHSLLGDSIVAWQGPCDIPFEHMVDGEDLIAKSEIRSALMLHFIVEKFDISLFAGVLMQRMLASLCLELIAKSLPQRANEFCRQGDDIYCGDRKLSISIASLSPVSCLIHFAVNISNENTPVKTCALSDFSILSRDFAETLMKNFCAEIESIQEATQKVLWVR